MPIWALRVSKWVPWWAMAVQLAALGAPENDFWFSQEPPGSILEGARILLSRFRRPHYREFPSLWPPIGLGGIRERKQFATRLRVCKRFLKYQKTF